jgi:DNA polymerase III delta subunit
MDFHERNSSLILLRMLVYYHGNDSYRIRQAVRESLERLRKNPDAPLQTVTVHAPNEQDREALEHALKYPSFFQEHTAVLVSDALSTAETAEAVNEILTRYAVQDLTDATVFVCQQEPAGRPSAASKNLAAYLARHATSAVEFMSLQGTARVQWIKDFCARRGCELTPRALADVLARSSPDDTWRLATDLANICAFSHETGRIDVHEVHALMRPLANREEWELSDALTRNDKRGVLSALFKRLAEGTSEHLIIGGLAAGLRTILMVKELAQRSLAPAGIAKKIGAHPFVVTKTLQGINSHDPQKLRKSLADLAALDRDIKNGTRDAVDGLYAAILQW